MANLSYLTLVGEKQGKISEGCSSQKSVGNKAQIAHTDEIMVYALSIPYQGTRTLTITNWLSLNR